MALVNTTEGYLGTGRTISRPRLWVLLVSWGLQVRKAGRHSLWLPASELTRHPGPEPWKQQDTQAGLQKGGLSWCCRPTNHEPWKWFSFQNTSLQAYRLGGGAENPFRELGGNAGMG